MEAFLLLFLKLLLIDNASQGLGGIFTGYYVTLCAAFSALGGLIFGYEYVGLNCNTCRF